MNAALRFLLVVVVGAFVWYLMAPLSLGGAVSYITVEGKSMEPTYFTGDLVVLRAQEDYAVGEIVAFRSSLAGAVIIHRIIGVETDGRFILQGDNNDFIDVDRPTPDDILGTEVAHFPGAAGFVTFLGQPVVMSALLGAAFLFLFMGLLSTHRRGRHRR